MDSSIQSTAMMMLHYTRLNNGNIHTPITLEHIMTWIEKYNKHRPHPKSKMPHDYIRITSSELA